AVAALVWQGFDRHRLHQEQIRLHQERIDNLRNTATTQLEQVADLDAEASKLDGEKARLKKEEALEALREARDSFRRLLQESPPNPLAIEFKVAELTLELGKQSELVRNSSAARRACREAQRAFEQLMDRLDKKHPDRARCQELLAGAYHWEGVAYLDEKNHPKAWER